MIRCAVILWMLFVSTVASAVASAVEVSLISPLSTMADVASEFPVREAVLSAQIEVPADAPGDLLVGAYAMEDGGAWRQSPTFHQLKPGRNHLALSIPSRPGAEAGMRAIAGLVFSSIGGAGLKLQITEVHIEPLVERPSQRVLDLAWDQTHTSVNQLWRLRLRPESSNGFRLEGHITDAAGVLTRLEGAAGLVGWSLTFTPPRVGRFHLAVVAHWFDVEQQVQSFDIDAEGALMPVSPIVASAPLINQTDISQTGMSQTGRAFRLSSPLRSCFGEGIPDGFSACRISARVLVGVDAPDDLIVGAYARDRAGRWRQARETLPLHPGENRIELLVPAGLAALDQRALEHGAGDAGLVCWSAQSSTAAVQVEDLHVESLHEQKIAEAGLDRLRLEGVSFARGGITAVVGSLWSVSVEPSPADGDTAGLQCRLSARVTDGVGRSQVVAGTVDMAGRQVVAFHPSIPGDYTVRLKGNWSDGRSVDSPLSRLIVTGDHPCPRGSIITMQGPLTQMVPLVLSGPVGALNRIEATVLVPDGAPTDLTVGVVAIDHNNHWFQQARAQSLHAGINRLDFPVDCGADVASEPSGSTWTASSLATFEKTALAFSTSTSEPLRLTVSGAVARPVPVSDAGIRPETATSEPQLVGLTMSATSGVTGERWSVSLRPDPFPANPYDPDDFRLDLMVTTPEGQTLLLPGFYAEDMTSIDRGDHELLRPQAGGFQVRYRPRTPGVHRLELRAAWRNGTRVRCELPALRVTGAAWDGYMRVDRKDPRFFTVDGNFFWPVGPNLRSVWDLRAQERMHTRITPDRGSLAYAAYLRRFSAAGANACEIWLSAWNLALEWRSDWPGFSGVGRYNQENAWRLDRILDAAWAEGMRVNLVINNHGQGSEKTDAEWMNNPYNRAAGGKLTSAEELFHDPWALSGQDKLRRYLVARYADHPAVMGWKLWTEMDLTNGGAYLQAWHERAAKRWRELDMYGHPVASHWCGDFRHPTEDIVSLLDYVCIDAYHGDEEKDAYRLVHRLLHDSTLDSEHGLSRLGRPILVTEYGGNWSGTRTNELMAVDHSCGAWVGFVSGHAGAPMLWWFEWVDQGNRFGPYGAIRRFVAGEDLRGAGHSIAVHAEGAGKIWSAVWRTNTRVFGYAIDERWAEDGQTAATVSAKFVLGENLPAGNLTCEWWDPDQGTIIATQLLQHPGGILRLTPPQFRKHLAWKIR